MHTSITYRTDRFFVCYGNRNSPYTINALPGPEDARELAAMEHALAQDQISSRLIMPFQTHSTVCKIITPEDIREKTRTIAADALITATPGIALGVATADCLPLTLYDPEHHACGIIHAGWRGLVGNIIQNTIALMKSTWNTNPELLHITIGAAAGVCCYEVDEAWSQQLPTAYKPFCQQIEAGYRFDLLRAAQHVLLTQNICETHIFTDFFACTICSEQYYSHRREKAHRRNVTLIGLSPIS